MDAQQQQHTGEPAAKRDRKEEDAPHDETMDAAQPSNAIEGLPMDILYKLVEYAPEVALEMRAVSKTLASCVDDYVVKVALIPMVSRMTFGDFRLPGSTTPDSAFGVMYSVDPKMTGLFHRRLHLLHPSEGDSSVSLFEAFKALRLVTMDASEKKQYEDELKKAEEAKDKGEEYTMPVVSLTKHVSMKFDLNNPEIDAQFRLFSECLGRRIAFVQMVEFKKTDLQYDNMEKILGEKNISTMKVCTALMYDENIIQLFRVITSHHVDSVEFGVTKFDSEMKKDLVNVLRDLSEQVRAIKIAQYNNNADNQQPAGGAAGTFLFGKNSHDWATLFIDMFKQKLNKLVIENKHNLDYLSEQDAEQLFARLPELGKQLWFEASCDKFANGYKEFHKNGFAVQADKKDQKGMLRIKHETRGKLEIESKP